MICMWKRNMSKSVGHPKLSNLWHMLHKCVCASVTYDAKYCKSLKLPLHFVHAVFSGTRSRLPSWIGSSKMIPEVDCCCIVLKQFTTLDPWKFQRLHFKSKMQYESMLNFAIVLRYFSTIASFTEIRSYSALSSCIVSSNESLNMIVTILYWNSAPMSTLVIPGEYTKKSTVASKTHP